MTFLASYVGKRSFLTAADAIACFGIGYMWLCLYQSTDGTGAAMGGRVVTYKCARMISCVGIVTIIRSTGIAVTRGDVIDPVCKETILPPF